MKNLNVAPGATPPAPINVAPFVMERRQATVIHHLGRRLIRLFGPAGRALLIEEASGEPLTEPGFAKATSERLDRLDGAGTMRSSLDLGWSQSPPWWVGPLLAIGYRVQTLSVLAIGHDASAAAEAGPALPSAALRHEKPQSLEHVRAAAAIASSPPLRRSATSARNRKALKRLIQCEMMDVAQVPNGSKAIAIAMHRQWNAAMIAAYGAPAPPRTIRHWRARRGRPGDRRIEHMIAMTGRCRRAHDPMKSRG